MKVLKSLVLFFTLCVLFTSCSVENEESPEKENVTKYYFNNQQVTLESLDQTKDLIYVHSKINEIEVFDSNEKFESYLIDLSLDYKPGSEMRAQIEKAVQLNKIGVKIALLADQQKESKTASEEMDQLLLELENLKSKSVKGAYTVNLYENPNYGGNSKATAGVVPSLRKKWRNKVSSFRAWGQGSVFLCDRTFFRGTKDVHPFVFSTFLGVPTLGGFDNRLESYY